jgi:TPR repeat protein
LQSLPEVKRTRLPTTRVDAYKAKNYAAAISHWSDSVLVGNTDAANNLAYLLYSGLGIAADKERAFKLWRLAAYAGQSEAQWHLGVAFEQGAADYLRRYAAPEP